MGLPKHLTIRDRWARPVRFFELAFVHFGLEFSEATPCNLVFGTCTQSRLRKEGKTISLKCSLELTRPVNRLSLVQWNATLATVTCCGGSSFVRDGLVLKIQFMNLKFDVSLLTIFD